AANNWLTLFLTWRLLLRNRHASGALTSARVCMRALATDGQRATMPESAIAPDVHQPFDVHLYALTQVALNFALRFEDRPDTTQLVIIQILYASVDVDCGLSKNRACARTTDTVNVSQPNLGPFIRWKIDACS